MLVQSRGKIDLSTYGITHFGDKNAEGGGATDTQKTLDTALSPQSG